MANILPLIRTPGNGQRTLLYSATTSANATEIEIPSGYLVGDCFEFLLDLDCSSAATAADMRILPNGSHSNVTYQWVIHRNISAFINRTSILTTCQQGQTLVHGFLRGTVGRARIGGFDGYTMDATGIASDITTCAVAWNDNSSALTSIKFDSAGGGAAVANAFKAGSRIWAWAV